MITLASGVFALVGAAAAAGGFVGFKRAGSRASLIAGSISGSALLGASLMITTGAVTAGLALGIATSVALAGRFAPAYVKTRKLMPQGVMAGLALAGVLAGVFGFLGA
jgi:uncharacterized membrane protein (UPF0136 family)